ncbi:MAG: ankyrin repeat domain-containing protein, partial [Anaerolineae bacterium]|nr:ankyrin repeat domain-containing protein [Anaerolineae bacterium]
MAEEARRDLDTAIAAYEAVLRATDEQRRLAATARFRLAECYRKTGRTNEAVAQFQQLLRDFPGEETLVRLGRQNLLALGAPLPQPPVIPEWPPVTPATPALLPSPAGSAPALATGAPAAEGRSPELPAASADGRSRQVALLEEEQRLLERQLGDARARFKAGVAPQSEIWSLERELLQLQRQLIGLRDRPRDLLVDLLPSPASNGSPSAAASATPSPDVAAQIAQIASFEQRSPKDPASLDAFLEAFPDPELSDLRKKLKDAEQHLASLRSNPDDQASEISAAESEISRLQARRRTRWDAVLDDQRARAQALGPAALGTGAGSGPAVSAADAADIARLDALVTQSPDLLNAPTGDPSMAPLHRAAANGQREVVRFLIGRGADANNRRSPQNWTPLHHAAARGHKAVVEFLLGAGADPNAPANDASRPLHQAVNREYVEVAKTLLAGGAQVDARGWWGENRQVMLPGSSYGYARDSAYTALHLAARQGSTNLVALLLQAKADPNATNSLLQTPLHLAVSTRQIPVVRLLLDAGADPARRDQSGNTPFHLALGARSQFASHGIRSRIGTADPELLEMLLKAGADPNPVNGWGTSPLVFVIGLGPAQGQPPGRQPADLGLVHVLLNAGARVDDECLDNEGEKSRPLFEAVANADLAAVRALLEAKAQPSLPTGPKGDTPLHRAVQNRNRALVELLLSRGADPSVRNAAGLSVAELLTPPAARTRPDALGIPGQRPPTATID